MTTVIEEKLENLRRCLARIRAKLPGTVDVFLADLDSQDIVAVNVERAVQICVDMSTHILAHRSGRSPVSMADCFAVLAEEKIITAQLAERLRGAVGMRNILVREYQAIDGARVHKILSGGLADLEVFARAVYSHDSQRAAP